jgi:hypothetical protein
MHPTHLTLYPAGSMCVRLAGRKLAEQRLKKGAAPWCSTESWLGSISTCSAEHGK